MGECRLAAEVLWGKKINLKYQELFGHITTFRIAVYHSYNNKKTGGEYLTNCPKLKDSLLALEAEPRDNPTDELSKKVNATVDDIAELVHPYLYLASKKSWCPTLIYNKIRLILPCALPCAICKVFNPTKATAGNGKT
ncbi:MAG: hypothetical protein QS748_06350 [Candidatus Endonucleobacter bathymodioli]|uniref:Uncharacterized protein n=1 Tax=Candidatus Endonucleibacter bathymodioli TaxID=539814 RepID=A0AA90P0P9_9GAMM|nr:hypothetical protein [Candidatus Endonucleobacter bathymodioli]